MSNAQQMTADANAAVSRSSEPKISSEPENAMSTTGLLLMDSYAGRTCTPVEIVGETPKRYRIRAIEDTKLAGRNRWLAAGETALVPKHAVRLTPAHL